MAIEQAYRAHGQDCYNYRQDIEKQMCCDNPPSGILKDPVFNRRQLHQDGNADEPCAGEIGSKGFVDGYYNIVGPKHHPQLVGR